MKFDLICMGITYITGVTFSESNRCKKRKIGD